MKLILIGASAGSIDQLLHIFEEIELKESSIITALHIPYSNLLNFERLFGCKIAQENEILESGKIYLCDSRYDGIDLYHGDQICYLRYNKSGSIYRPDIDTLFLSASKSKDVTKMMGILLSGIGENGARGLLALKKVGAHTIVSDEKSSFVYGMPKAAVGYEGAKEILGIEEIINRMQRFIDV